MSIDWDIEELAYRAMGKSEEQTEEEINNGDIEEALCEKYGVDFQQYCEIVKDLIKFTPMASSPFSKKNFHTTKSNS